MSRRVTATAPARPVSAAATRSTKVGAARAATCVLWLNGSSCGRIHASAPPIATVAMTAPTSVTADLTSAWSSPNTIASAMPWVGVASGAMIIAPITVGVESLTIPAVAIPAASTSSSQNRLCLARASPVLRNTASRISSVVRISPASTAENRGRVIRGRYRRGTAPPSIGCDRRPMATSAMPPPLRGSAWRGRRAVHRARVPSSILRNRCHTVSSRSMAAAAAKHRKLGGGGPPGGAYAPRDSARRRIA